MNLTTLTQVAAQFANDSQQTRYAGLYTQALNLGQDQFALDAKVTWKDWPSTTIVSGQASYPLPSDFMWEKKVTCNGLMLLPISRAELDRQFTASRWDTLTGTPRNYIVDPDVQKNQLLLFPIPQGNDAGNDLVLTYFALPVDLANGTDTPLNANPLLVQFHIGIAAWAAWYLLGAENATPEMTQKRKDLLQIYNDCVSQATDTFRNTVSAPLRQRGGGRGILGWR